MPVHPPRPGACLRRRHRGHALLRLTAVAGGALSGLLGCAQDAAQPLPVPRAVMLERVRPAPAPIALRRFPGRLQAADRTRLAFETGGRVALLSVELGDRFARGDLLGRLEDRPATLALEAREADLADARAVLADARLDYERRASLEGSGAVSQSAIDSARARFESARARVDALVAEVGAARERLEDTRLRAPFDGEVAARLVEPSQVVSAGQPVLSVIGGDAGLEAVIHVPQRFRAAMTRGMTGEVVAPAGESPVAATVIEIGAEANAAGLVPLTLAVEAAEHGRLTPGQSVEARLQPAPGDTRHLLIPLTAYAMAADGGARVFTVDAEENTLRAITVRLVETREEGAVVDGPLAPGDRIVACGVDLLEDGQRVSPAGSGLARYNF